MLFNSFAYLIFFAVVMLGAKLLGNMRLQHCFLLVASIYFYAAWNTYLVVLILASAAADYVIALRMSAADSPGRRRCWLVLSLASNLGLLFFFKYTNFFLDSFYASQHWLGLGLMPHPVRLQIILPVGISFYTFQTLSYTLDVYRGKLEPTRNFLKFLLFISFFPQLIAGPIVRASDFLPQLEKRAEVLPANLKIGFTLFLAGLVKKVVFADALGIFVEKIYSAPTLYSSVPIVLATLAYAVQIYCDFSGYTDMAIGSATALGFWLPKNFNYPYLAGNLTEFWQRWHISLSTWLRDYLYIPLGGNRRGSGRTYVNLLLTMLLGGFWHGARWTFVCWGAYQGALLALHRYYSTSLVNSKWLKSLVRVRQTWLFHFLCVGVTLYLVLIGWILFRAQNFADAQHLLHKFIVFDGFHQAYGIYLREALSVLILIGLFTAIHLSSFRLAGLAQRLAHANAIVWCGCITGGLLLIMLLAPTRSPEFIYFQF